MYYSKNCLKEVKTFENTSANVFVTISEKNHKGDVVKQYSTQDKKRYSKRGWSRMYHKDYAEATIEVTKDNSFATILFNYMLKNNYFKRDGTVKGFTQIKLAKELESTRQRVSRALLVLKKHNMLQKYEEEWFYNPFLIYVSVGKDDEIFDAQLKWEELFGHYIFEGRGTN